MGDIPPGIAPSAEFHTTHWSVVVSAGDGDSTESARCRSTLCELYWFPVYCFIRKMSNDPDRAKDLTQGFFEEFLHKNSVAKADPDRGRFRSFLMTSVQNYLRNAHDHRTALKRGGPAPPLALHTTNLEERYRDGHRQELSPVELFERQWAHTLLARVLDLLRQEFDTAGRTALFDALTAHLWGDAESIPYADLAREYGLTLVNTKVTAYRLRLRYREILRQEIADTVDSPRQIDDEIRHLMRVVST